MRSSVCAFLVGLGAVSALPACGGDDAAPGSGGSGGNGGQGGGGGEGPAAAVRFFVDERPHDATNEEIEATEARWSDPVRIVVEGLAPGRRVRLDVSTGAWAVLVADAAGSVDLARDAPAEGSWTTVDADGPFWSAPPATTPVFDIDVTVTDADAAAELGMGSLRRRPVNEGVEVTEVNDGTRVGFLTRPAGVSGPLPAVLAFGGSEGGTYYGQFMAYYLAQLGYASFGVAYFGAPGLSPDLERVPLEILKDDLDYLASQPGVDPDRIAVLGASRGGELALLLGATFPDQIHAVVAQVPSGYVWGATTGNDVSAWTLGGVDVPHVPSSGAPVEYTMRDGNTYAVTTPSFLADIAAAPPATLAAAAIPVAATGGPVLLLGGEDDQLWPSCVLADVAWDALTAAGHTASHADETHCFPDAGHLISFPPGSSTLANTAVYYEDIDIYLVTGGTPEGIARAEREGNTVTRAFLEEALGGS